MYTYDGSSAFNDEEVRRDPMVERVVVVELWGRIEKALLSEWNLSGADVEATLRFGIKPNIAVGIAFADMWWQ